ncbi:MAG: helix-turn-helix domain-containing protein [Planctomycetes bacterium]|nr:helix-turn-helix domain-containing protein [Planctomycetota bacterium]
MNQAVPQALASDSSDRFGPFVRSRRESLHLTLAQVASSVGCAKGYLSAVENGVRPPPGDEILARLEAALQLPAARLVEMARWERSLAAGGPSVRREVARLQADSAAARKLADLLRAAGGDGRHSLDAAYASGELRRCVEALSGPEKTASNTAMRPMPLALAREVPVINKVAAGYPCEFTDLSYPARIADEYVRCPDVEDQDAFAARVVGDSMEPKYSEGDIVIFSPARPVKDGMDCFARLEPDHESTFKRVYFEEQQSGTHIRLQPLNSAYPPRILPRERVAGLYAAVSVLKRI